MSTPKLVRPVVVLLMTLVGASATAQAEVVTQTFTGSVTFASGSLFGASPASGDPVQGSITYDTSQLPAYDFGDFAGYIQMPPSGMQVTISGLTLSSQNYNSFQVLNNAFGVDNFNGFFSPVSVNGAALSDWSSISFSLTDFTLTALSGTALPAPLDVARFSQRIGSIYDASSGGFLSFAIDSRDADGDGIPDTADSCPNSNLSLEVVIGACTSGVPNKLLANGCTISDRVSQCAAGAANHGRFVSCVSEMSNGLVQAGVITGQQHGAIQSCAAQARIP